MWARGLKLATFEVLQLRATSRPVWARGLKLPFAAYQLIYDESRPVWARGLKQNNCVARRKMSCRAPCGRVD